MGETLGRFIAASVEFIAGGILFGATLLVALLQLPGVDELADDALQSRWLTVLPSGALAVAGLGLAYALGIYAESVSRVTLERWLDTFTLREWKGRLEEGETAQERREADRLWILASRSEAYREVESQLRRMRLERTWLLCLAILTLALTLGGITSSGREQDASLGGAAAAFLAFVGCCFIVRERFQRYCKVIRELARDRPPPVQEPEGTTA